MRIKGPGLGGGGAPGTDGSAPSGTSFPASPSDGDKFYRTDRNIEYYYNNSISRWLSTTLYIQPMGGGSGGNYGPQTVTGGGAYRATLAFWNEADIYLEKVKWSYLLSVAGSWTLTLVPVTGSSNGSSILSQVMNVTTAWTGLSINVNSIIASTVNKIDTNLTENSGAAALYLTDIILLYRVVG